MGPLPKNWRIALRREMTPSWFGWVLIASLSGLIVAWWRGLGAEVFYPLQYAVAYVVSGEAQIFLTLTLIMYAIKTSASAFGPLAAIVASGPVLWTKGRRSWSAWALIAWGFSAFPLVLGTRRILDAAGRPLPADFYFSWMWLIQLTEWSVFIVFAWLITRSRWATGAVAVLCFLWWIPIDLGALDSILWHAALFAVFLAWALHKRMSPPAVPAPVAGAPSPLPKNWKLRGPMDESPRLSIAL